LAPDDVPRHITPPPTVLPVTAGAGLAFGCPGRRIDAPASVKAKEKP
jgi:hypothetical protein